MREIKFRAWGRWSTPEVPGIPKKKMYYHIEDGVRINPLDRNYYGLSEVERIFGWKLMQYTGLKDKNGKEIYEGDIVKYPNYQGVVEYCGDRFHIAPVPERSDLDPEDLGFHHHAHQLEVIGNIYENPELVETK